ncbi:glutamate-1-semialdehyde 2,1-aminomutase [Evansella caseinilytica]|uniref:Glutamate-1-semialdehyde 2,1-aminomutase n=1 Tax=Evansella caseinilytica TaxID=1503961 RepID=A0A1H3PNB3_9BACI|nr:aspartate aminotransferase family protein [Evansella caseinilytica]SDZ02430.1 glutamate-1-semialdehyde 2,1-aminomutase [Evansella caseinilytica]
MAIQNIEHPMMKYSNRTKNSYREMEKAANYLPGGVTANIKHFSPYPVVMESAGGAWIKDVDGNQYIDYLMAYGSLALGHGHDDIKQAMADQLAKDGTVLFGTPHPLEYRFAEKIQAYYPSMERLRYTNSGTEATLLAIRLATAYTGKKRIAKFEGHYHGGYNEVLYSINPPLVAAGEMDDPRPVPESSGLEMFTDQRPVILPFNRWQATERLLRQHADELAAVIIEPVQGGFIPAEKQFIEDLRKLTATLQIALIFDEVKTGFRVAMGGAQELYGVKPDLTTLGKVVGGGFPIGIVGGKEAILNRSRPKGNGDVFDVGQGKSSAAREILFHSGTYNGHPTILAAGLAAIHRLEQDFAHTVLYTETMRKDIEALGRKNGIPLKAVGVGTIFNVVCTETTIRHYRDLQKTDLELRKQIDFHLLNEGIYTKPLNRYSISTAHGERELELTLTAYETVLKRVFKKKN